MTVDFLVFGTVVLSDDDTDDMDTFELELRDEPPSFDDLLGDLERRVAFLLLFRFTVASTAGCCSLTAGLLLLLLFGGGLILASIDEEAFLDFFLATFFLERDVRLVDDADPDDDEDE